MTRTLIQLVSEQTMQNLLPVLRLKPARLVHLVTPRTVARSAWIAEAVRQSGCSVELEATTLSAMPGMRETMKETLAAIERGGAQGEEVLVNFTGGTKLMSIGAYVAALKHKTPSFYVDTQDDVFVDGQSAEGLESAFQGDLSFTPILRSLTVDSVAAANGCGRVTGGHDWRPFLPLALHLHTHPDDEHACHITMHGSRGQHPPFANVRRAAQWLNALDQDIPLPEAVARLAVDAGLFRPGSQPHALRLPDDTRHDLIELARLDGTGKVAGFHTRLFKAIAPLQSALNFLGGSWWEIIVAERMRECGRFRDLRWSAQVGERRGAELEEDVVALDGVRIVHVSCKRSSQGGRLLPLLEQINARANRLGGAFNHRFLAIRQPPTGRTLANLQHRADDLDIRLLFPSHITKPDPFS